jgi:hypothetical protein
MHDISAWNVQIMNERIFARFSLLNHEILSLWCSLHKDVWYNFQNVKNPNYALLYYIKYIKGDSWLLTLDFFFNDTKFFLLFHSIRICTFFHSLSKNFDTLAWGIYAISIATLL